jgi:2-methylisocitrate lyase-like PEP mutase family enzyme
MPGSLEKAGCEALFVGTGGVVGAYTGLADVGTTTMTECVTIARWIADGVSSTTLHTKWPSSRWTKSAAA